MPARRRAQRSTPTRQRLRYDIKSRIRLRRIVRSAAKLSPPQRLIACALLDHMDAYTGLTWATLPRLAEECKLERTTAFRCLQELVRFGFLRATDERRGRTGRIPVFEVIEPTAQTIQAMDAWDAQMVAAQEPLDDTEIVADGQPLEAVIVARQSPNSCTPVDLIVARQSSNGCTRATQEGIEKVFREGIEKDKTPTRASADARPSRARRAALAEVVDQRVVVSQTENGDTKKTDAPTEQGRNAIAALHKMVRDR